MTYVVTPEDITAIRVELGDTDISLPVMTEDEISYFLTKNNGSIARATIDTAKSLLFKLSYRTDKTVDILSLKPSKSTEMWIQALKLYLKDSSLNPMLNNLNGWIGNTSRSEMQENIENPDNYVTSLAVPDFGFTTPSSDNPFSI